MVLAVFQSTHGWKQWLMSCIILSTYKIWLPKHLQSAELGQGEGQFCNFPPIPNFSEICQNVFVVQNFLAQKCNICDWKMHSLGKFMAEIEILSILLAMCSGLLEFYRKSAVFVGKLQLSPYLLVLTHMLLFTINSVMLVVSWWTCTAYLWLYP